MRTTIFETEKINITLNSSNAAYLNPNNPTIKTLKELFEGFHLLLNLDLFFTTYKKSKVVKDLFKLLEKINANDEEWRTVYGSLYFLLSGMEWLKTANEAAYKGFLRDIRKQSTSSAWKGFQFEIVTARGLVEKKLSFVKRESPDFELNYNGTVVYIECALTQATGESDKVLRYKVESKIQQKNKKKYATKDTCLFLDITNIFHRDFYGNRLDYFNELCESLEWEESFSFGGVVLFVTFADEGGYGQAYRTLKGKWCSAALNMFLDEYYPQGDYKIYDTYIIPESI